MEVVAAEEAEPEILMPSTGMPKHAWNFIHNQKAFSEVYDGTYWLNFTFPVPVKIKTILWNAYFPSDRPHSFPNHVVVLANGSSVYHDYKTECSEGITMHLLGKIKKIKNCKNQNEQYRRSKAT